MRDEYEITDAIQVLIQDGYPVRASNSIVDDINLTTPSDLLVCNLLMARNAGQPELKGDNISMHAGASIRSSVIGSNVSILNPVRVSESLIFDGTVVDAQTDFHRYIITPEFKVECDQGLTVAQRGLLQ
jgi:dTDP-glucose pyrophosphorylase